MPTQDYTVGHTGTVLEDAGESAVWLYQNQVNPRRETEIAEFRCPSNFDQISWVGERDPVRFEPRTYEDKAPDANGVISVDAELLPVAGETAVKDQPYPVVEVYNAGIPATVESVDYAANTVTVDSGLSGTNLDVFPIVAEGTFKMRGKNALDQATGPVFPWGHPIYRWHDFKQDKRGTEVNLSGGITWMRDETLQVMVDSPTQVVWEHADYPDAYVSTLELDCRITF